MSAETLFISNSIRHSI